MGLTGSRSLVGFRFEKYRSGREGLADVPCACVVVYWRGGVGFRRECVQGA